MNWSVTHGRYALSSGKWLIDCNLYNVSLWHTVVQVFYFLLLDFYYKIPIILSFIVIKLITDKINN